MLTKIKSNLKYIITAIAAIGDAVTTIIGVSSGKAYEANPSGASLQESIGLVQANLLTAILFFLFVSLTYRVSDEIKTKLFKYVLSGAATGILIFKLLVVVNNLFVIF